MISLPPIFSLEKLSGKNRPVAIGIKIGGVVGGVAQSCKIASMGALQLVVNRNHQLIKTYPQPSTGGTCTCTHLEVRTRTFWACARFLALFFTINLLFTFLFLLFKLIDRSIFLSYVICAPPPPSGYGGGIAPPSLLAWVKKGSGRQHCFFCL